MTLRTYTIEKKKDTHKQVWEWEETPEVIAAIEQLNKSSQVVKDLGEVNKIHIVNNNSAPHKSRKES